MEISSERLILTEISRDDLQNIHQLHSIPEVDQYNTLGLPSDIEETRELVRAEEKNPSHKGRLGGWLSLCHC